MGRKTGIDINSITTLSRRLLNDDKHTQNSFSFQNFVKKKMQISFRKRDEKTNLICDKIYCRKCLWICRWWIHKQSHWVEATNARSSHSKIDDNSMKWSDNLRKHRKSTSFRLQTSLPAHLKRFEQAEEVEIKTFYCFWSHRLISRNVWWFRIRKINRNSLENCN